MNIKMLIRYFLAKIITMCFLFIFIILGVYESLIFYEEGMLGWFSVVFTSTIMLLIMAVFEISECYKNRGAK